MTQKPKGYIIGLHASNMTTLTQNPQKYQVLIEEIKATLVEYEFTSRWALVEGYHKVGELIVKSKTPVTVTKLASDIKKSEKTIKRCIQFYKKYPSLHALPEGKDTSWHQIVNKYLPEPKEEKPQPVDKNLIKCPNCKFLFSYDDINEK